MASLGGYVSLQASCAIAIVDNSLESLGVKFGFARLSSGFG